MELETLIRDMEAEGNQNLIVDLRESPMISSSTLGILIICQASYARRNAQFRLRNCGPRIRNILKTTKQDDRFGNGDDDSASSPASP